MNATHRPRPGWAPVNFGEDENLRRHRLTRGQIGLCLLALGIGIYGGLTIAAAWLTT